MKKSSLIHSTSGLAYDYATAETGGGYASSWSNSLPLLTSSTVGGASVAASVTVAAATPAAAVTVSHTASA
ncbi:hypothetical protein ABTG40_19465, partial [Acinetobacter baumannii]